MKRILSLRALFVLVFKSGQNLIAEGLQLIKSYFKRYVLKVNCAC